MPLGVPAPCAHLGVRLFFSTARDEWFLDIERLNELLPGGIINREDSLVPVGAFVFLVLLTPLFFLRSLFSVDRDCRLKLVVAQRLAC